MSIATQACTSPEFVLTPTLTIISSIEQNVAKMTLIGRLDAQTEPSFNSEIEKIVERQPKTVVFFFEQIECMASAGIRMLILTRQKLGADVDIYIVGAHEQIVQTLVMAGVDKSVILVDELETVSTSR